MFHFLLDMLRCPACHSALDWHMDKQDAERVLDATAHCPHCQIDYPVSDGIADFRLEEARQADHWQTGSDRLAAYMQSRPDIIARLMGAGDAQMSAADMMVKAMMLKREGRYAEYDRLNQLSSQLAYTKDSQQATESQFNYLTALLSQKTGFVLDLATGMGTLARRLLAQTALPVVATDISMHVLKETRDDLRRNGYADRACFFAFARQQTPFAPGCVALMTTYAGLQNLAAPNQVLSELRRVSSGAFYSICDFCSEDDATNRTDLQESGLEVMHIRDLLLDEFIRCGWDVRVCNAITALREPTPVGTIVPGVGIDGFPVAPGMFEHCIVEACAK